MASATDNGFERLFMDFAIPDSAGEREWAQRQFSEVSAENWDDIFKAATGQSRHQKASSQFIQGVALLTQAGEVHSVTDRIKCSPERRHAIDRVIDAVETPDGHKDIKAIGVVSDMFEQPCVSCRQRVRNHSGNSLFAFYDDQGGIRAITTLLLMSNAGNKAGNQPYYWERDLRFFLTLKDDKVNRMSLRAASSATS